MIFMGNDRKNEMMWSFAASLYWAVLMNFMGDDVKNVDKTCYLQHHGTAPFW